MVTPVAALSPSIAQLNPTVNQPVDQPVSQPVSPIAVSSKEISKKEISQKDISMTLPKDVEKPKAFSITRFKMEHHWDPNRTFTPVDRAYAELTGEVYEKSSKSIMTCQKAAYKFLHGIYESLKKAEKFKSDDLDQLLEKMGDLEPKNIPHVLKAAQGMIERCRSKNPEAFKNFAQVNAYLQNEIDNIDTNEAASAQFIKTKPEIVVLNDTGSIKAGPSPASSSASKEMKAASHFPSRSTILKVTSAVALAILAVGYYVYGMPACLSNLGNYLSFKSNPDPLPPTDNQQNQVEINPNNIQQPLVETPAHLAQEVGVNSAIVQSLAVDLEPTAEAVELQGVYKQVEEAIPTAGTPVVQTGAQTPVVLPTSAQTPVFVQTGAQTPVFVQTGAQTPVVLPTSAQKPVVVPSKAQTPAKDESSKGQSSIGDKPAMNKPDISVNIPPKVDANLKDEIVVPSQKREN